MYDSPPFWEHGVFLQPQHFQMERLQAQRMMAAVLPLLNPYLWGLRRLAINEAALGSGSFEIVSLELLLPTGEWALVPDNATLPPRNFQEVWTNPETPLTVQVGLAVLREQGGNVFRSDDPAQAAETFRFTAPLSPEAVPDLYGDGPGAEVQTLRYNLRLCFGPEEGEGLWRFPVARLIRDGERVRLDPRFAPP